MVGRFVGIQLATFVLYRCPATAGFLVRVDDALAVDGPSTRRAEDGLRFVGLYLTIRQQIADELLTLDCKKSSFVRGWPKGVRGAKVNEAYQILDAHRRLSRL